MNFELVENLDCASIVFDEDDTRSATGTSDLHVGCLGEGRHATDAIETPSISRSSSLRWHRSVATDAEAVRHRTR